MATIIEMPKLSDTMESGTLVSWKKNEGDAVEPGEVLAEVESDKATMELEAFDRGILRKIIAKVGESIPIGKPLAIVSESADENIDAMLAGLEGDGGKPTETPAPQAAEAKPETAQAQAIAAAETPAEGSRMTEPGPAPEATAPRRRPEPEARPQEAAQAPAAQGRVAVSPLAARLAQELGLDLTRIKGTGPDGRVIKRDIERAKAEGGSALRPVGMIPSAPAPGLAHPEWEYEDIPNSQMRKIIAQRLAESMSQIPHYYVTIEIDMRQALELRKQLNALEGVKISINDFILKAAGKALEKHPLVNASYQGSSIRAYHRIDIGMAVAMEDGLITPVIRNINKKGLLAISKETRELTERARNKKLRPEEYTGSTFTVSNLGMLGVKHFTAVINPPEAGILAVGATQAVPVVEKGQVTVGYRMEVTMSSDHRVIDGAQSARFLQDFKYFLENPITFAL